jgi:hypothetical protein
VGLPGLNQPVVRESQSWEDGYDCPAGVAPHGGCLWSFFNRVAFGAGVHWVTVQQSALRRMAMRVELVLGGVLLTGSALWSLFNRVA